MSFEESVSPLPEICQTLSLSCFSWLLIITKLLIPPGLILMAPLADRLFRWALCFPANLQVLSRILLGKKEIAAIVQALDAYTPESGEWQSNTCIFAGI